MLTQGVIMATEPEKDWACIGRRVFSTEIEGLEAVRDKLGKNFADAVALLAVCAGRVALVGIGKSGLAGRKIAATFSSTGTPALFLHPVEAAHGDLGIIRDGDVVIAVSNSGRTEEVNSLIPVLRSLGAKIIAMTGNGDSPLAQLADITLDIAVPREACPLDLAPTASTTATVAMGDALAICLMHAKGFSPEKFRAFHPGGSLGQRLLLRVSELMHTKNLPVADIGASLGEAVRVLDDGKLGAVFLVDNDTTLCGILTDGDIRRQVRRGGLDLAAPAASVMIGNPRHGRQGQSAAELLDIMENAAITVLPVTSDAGRLLGAIHLHDLLGKGQIRFS